MTDHEDRWSAWMQAANSGDRTAYRALLNAVTPYVRGLALRKAGRSNLGDDGDVEDIVQEILLAIHLKRATWDPERPLKPWIVAIASNKAIDAMRRRGYRKFVPIDDVDDATLADDREAAVLPHQADRLLSTLKGKQLEVVRAMTIEELSVEDTAKRLSMSHGAVRVALHRGLGRLSQVYRKFRE